MVDRRLQGLTDALTPLTIQQIDGLLEFLPHLEAVARGDYATGSSGINAPGTPQANRTWDFFMFLYGSGVVQDAEWMHRLRQINLPNSRESLSGATLNEIHILLIAHTRVDRISEGHFNKMVENGFFEMLLQRLKVLREELPEPN